MSGKWRWIKLSHAYPRIGSGTTPPDEDGAYVEDGSGTNWVTTSELRESRICETKKQVSDDALRRYPTLRVYRPGSVMFAMYGATIGRLGVLDKPACCNQACCVFEHSKMVSNRYLVYWLQHRKNDLVALSVGGGQPNLSQQDLRNEKVYCPDLPTQRAIADFLDRETARIDLLIEKKQRLVALLGEKAKVAKLDLVTGKGSGSIRDSKTVWSPHIPAHWEERAVWMLFELGRGRVISHEYIAENEGPYPIYSSQTADDGVMGSIDTYDFDGEYLTWTTDGAKAGTVFRRKGKFNCTNVCGTLRPLTQSIDLDYAQFALDMATDFFVRHDINPKLMNGVMSKIRIPYPPLEEQQEIGRQIMGIEDAYRPIAMRTQVSIDRLKEYRSALITAAVTGQINVSEWGKEGSSERLLDSLQAEMEH